MTPVTPLRSADAGDPPAPRRGASPAPLYRRVIAELEALAMGTAFDDTDPLPPESALMARFGVSRGTLRRAVEELVREGLLSIEPGRGTFVVQSTKVRWTVWDRLQDVAVADSRFDRDLSRFVPDFEGRDRADDALWSLPEYHDAATVFFAPDNSLESARARALRDGKRILVPTFGMRRGFILLDGTTLAPDQWSLAATLDGMERLGVRVDLAGLRALSTVDLIVTGAVAVTRRGLHFGGGDGFFDLEWALLRHCGLATSRTLVVVIAHDCQVLDEDIRPGRHDAIADLVITPTRVVRSEPPLPKPDGIIWEEIRTMWNDDISYVRELRDELAPGMSAPSAARRRGLDR